MPSSGGFTQIKNLRRHVFKQHVVDEKKKYPGTSDEARAWLREQGYEVIEEDNKKKLLAQNITSGLSPFRK